MCRLTRNAISMRTIEEWYLKFRSGGLTFEGASQYGRITDDHDLQQALQVENSITSPECTLQTPSYNKSSYFICSPHENFNHLPATPRYS